MSDSALQKWRKASLLGGSSDDCVLSQKNRDACLLTVQEFNTRVAFCEPPPGDSDLSDSAIRAGRRGVVEELLDSAFLQSMWVKEGRKSDVAKTLQKHEAQKGGEFRKSAGDTLLKRLYRENFEEVFSARNFRSLSVLGSTDSSFQVVSARGACDSGADRRFCRLFQGPMGSPAGWAEWRGVRRADLPTAMRSQADSLRKPGQTSKLLRLPFGFFQIRLDAIEREDDMPFESAVPLLFKLHNLEQLAKDSPDSAASASSDAPMPSFELDDSLPIKAWLAPFFRFGRKSEISRAWNSPRDTADFAGMEMALSDLPDSARALFVQSLSRVGRGRVGPFRDALGMWYFAPITAPKRSSRSSDAMRARADLERKKEALRNALAIQERKTNSLGMSLFREWLIRSRAPQTEPGGKAAGGSSPSWREGQARYDMEKRSWVNENLEFFGI